MTLVMMVDVVVAMMTTMTMIVVIVVANPGHVPTRQSNERSISSTTDHHGQVNSIIITNTILTLLLISPQSCITGCLFEFLQISSLTSV